MKSPLTLSFAVLCLAACPTLPSDMSTEASQTTAFVTSSETGTPDTTSGGAAICDTSPGKAMAPCKPGNVCDDDLVCIAADSGTFCSPPCAECHANEHAVCIAHLSSNDEFTCKADQGCVLPCSNSSDCENGTICNATEQICTWPSGARATSRPSRPKPIPCIVAEGCPDGMVCDPGINGGTCVKWP